MGGPWHCQLPWHPTSCTDLWKLHLTLVHGAPWRYIPHIRELTPATVMLLPCRQVRTELTGARDPGASQTKAQRIEVDSAWLGSTPLLQPRVEGVHSAHLWPDEAQHVAVTAIALGFG